MQKLFENIKLKTIQKMRNKITKSPYFEQSNVGEKF